MQSKWGLLIHPHNLKVWKPQFHETNTDLVNFLLDDSTKSEVDYTTNAVDRWGLNKTKKVVFYFSKVENQTHQVN